MPTRSFGYAIIALALIVATASAGIDVRRHGAVGDGSADDSAAIQKALQAAAAQGGSVELGVGRFRLNSPITIPEGVALVGVWEAPHHAQLYRGTVIEAYAGKGNENGPPLITLNPSTTVKGITFFYPEQRIPGTQPYPWTIQGVGMHGNVIDCTFVNPYKMIEFAGRGNELHHIRNCFGCPLKAGIRIDNCSDIGRIENVHFNPHYWARTDAPNKPAWPPLSQYLAENLVAFEFARTDWEYVHNTFVFGAKIGYRFVATEGGTVNGNFLGIGADWCGRAILVEQCQMPGLLITNGEFVGAQGTDAMMEVLPSNTGPVQLNNCSFWGPADRIAITDGKGTVSFQQCAFRNHGDKEKDAYSIEARGGDLIVQSCRFDIVRPDIHIGPAVDTAVVMGNWFRRSKEILNESKGDIQIGVNVVGQRPATTPAP